jgi:hypothetical protein
VTKLPIVICWAIAFGYVEAAVVEYLRAVYHPIESGGFYFPLQTIEGLRDLGQSHVRRLVIELGREASTLIMLAATGFAAGRNFREGFAHFMIAFGIWDIFYYVWLKVFLDWPQSLMTWDLLFLLPVPWVSPVIAPIIISVVMIVSGVLILHYESKGFELRTTAKDWLFLTAGGIVVVTAFCWDHRNISSGGMPESFFWSLFFFGLIVSATAFAWVLYRNVFRAQIEPPKE